MPPDADNPLAVVGEAFGSLFSRAVLYLSSILCGLSIGGSLVYKRYLSTGEIFEILSSLDLGTFFLHSGAFLIHPLIIVLLFIYIRCEGSHLILMIPLAAYTWLGYALTKLMMQQAITFSPLTWIAFT